MNTSKFVKFPVSDKEQILGQLLTNLNKQVLHNMRTEYAEEKLALKFTPNDVMTFAQQEAELQGKILILSYILDCAELAESDHTLVVQPAED